MNRSTTAGFTLIELMIVVVIVAILASIAVPAYTSSVRKSRRTEAKTAIMDFGAREERIYATQNAYSTDPGVLGYTAAGGSWPVSTGTYYQIDQPTVFPATVTATGTTPPTFTVTVEPTPGSSQSSDTACATFTLTNTGLQGATGNNPTSCWP
ncbi:MAG TPA: type IV pilin protein [Steroidobacteraceae bacterium]